MKEDLITLKKFYLQAAAQIPADSFFHESINHKFCHSVAVWQTGRKIMAQTPELADADSEFKTLAERALLFHDVGRFHEAVCRYQALQQNISVSAASNRFDHGIIGYDLLKDMPLYNDLRILLAIKYHGKMMDEVRASDLWQQAEQSPLGDDAKKILYLVRDADKLANLQVIKSKNHLQHDIFFKLLSDEALHAPISAAVWQQFLARQTVVFTNLHSFADRIVMVLSWIFDLNYQYTKKAFISEGYARFLLNELAKYHTNTADLDRIRLLISSIFKK
jgi:hypothetical protein